MQLFFLLSRMCKSEGVQYFQFDSEGNMYVYPPGSGFAGIPKLVMPGDELFKDEVVASSQDFSLSGYVDGDVNALHSNGNLSTQDIVTPSCEFKKPLDEEKLNDLCHKNFSPETMKKVKWVLKMFREWRSYRHSNGYEYIPCDLDHKSTISEESLIFAMSRFITEVKKVDGSDFPGKTLYEIVICVQFHLETLGFGWKILNEEPFKNIKFTLDNVMKMRTSQGIGNSVRKAQVLTSTDEEYLWSLGLFGTHSPEALLNTLVFMIGKGFALRAGKEHHALRAPPFDSQIEFMHDEGGVFLRYTEDTGFKTKTPQS